MSGREAHELSEAAFNEMFMHKIELGNPDIQGFPEWNGPKDEPGTQDDAGNEYNLSEVPF